VTTGDPGSNPCLSKKKIFFFFVNLQATVWKFQDFLITQILREINFVDLRSTKTAVFDILGAVDFVYLLNFRLYKVQKFVKVKIQSL